MQVEGCNALATLNRGAVVARKGTGGSFWLLIVVVAAVMIPRDVWITIGVIAAIAAAVYAYVRWQSSTKATQPPPAEPIDQGPTLAELMSPPRRTRAPAARSSLQSRAPQRPAGSEEFYAAEGDRQHTSGSGYSIPPAPAGFTGARWIPYGQAVEVAGTLLPAGMIYFGHGMTAPNGITEPCLINPRLKVARNGDFRERHTYYWPSYDDISPTARRAYLNWLAEGRSHPDCDLGYVFLFFYGLERRVVIDTANDSAIRQEWPTVKQELHRLLGIYGQSSGSFRRYAGELLNFMELAGASDRLYEQPLPSFPKAYELPAYLRLALGQAALDHAPVPPQLALAWVRMNPENNLRTAATRCPDEFEQLFIQRYQDLFGPGLILPKNRTKLKFVYHGASASFRGVTVSFSYGDVPDVTALTAPIKSLMVIANQCTDELGSFSRLIGKDPEARSSLEGLLNLPATLWPSDAKGLLEDLTKDMRDGMLTLPLGEIIARLGGSGSSFDRNKVRALARTLEAINIGFEPHVLEGARTPSDKDPVVLFAMPTSDIRSTNNSAYQAAALTLQLASAVAQADGDFNENEIAHLRAEIEGWSHITPAHRQRLHAHLSWLVAAPITLQSLRKKLDPLETKAKETVAAFMATLAQSDGLVSPEEIKFLEKVYKALGVEPRRVFSDIHAVGSGAGQTPQEQKGGFRLDAERIAMLQKDTERVSQLLSEIFTEEEPTPPPVAVEEESTTQSGLLGLDEGHSALLRLILSRPQWARAELDDAAADLELMLDGALEQINEASFDTYDLPLFEGEDPIDVNSEVVEKIES